MEAPNRPLAYPAEFGILPAMTATPHSPSRTGLIFSATFLNHNAEILHPESPSRLRAIVEGLKAAGLWSRLVPLTVGPATEHEIARVHTREYLQLLDRSEGHYLDPDTWVGDGSPPIARLAAGGVIAAARAVWSGALANAFCAVRPPGHHALAGRGMGFCLLNNIAIAAADLLAHVPEARVLIVDWDVHHGNGTQAIFYESPQVMYASLHQYPFYPGTGAASETGCGSGVGFTVNRPLWAGAGDAEFLGALDSILAGPAHEFRPDVVLVSAGFDAHEDDPLAQLTVTTEGFAAATRAVCAFARAMCGGRLVSVLEGGYDLTALGECVTAHVKALMAAGESKQEGEDKS